MFFNTLQLKPGVTIDDVELAIGEMCAVVNNTYGGEKGGGLGGQVFKFSGFVSDVGSLAASRTADDHVAIVTYWKSYNEHERSHADQAFHAAFSAVASTCTDSKELGYDMLWQGEPEGVA
jgi:hypothetical protein